MTDRYAVFGNPLGHSKSPLIHMGFAQATGQDIEYTKVEAPIDGFAACLHAFRAGGGHGVNVTAPFKLEAYALATKRNPRAELAGAANCLKFNGEEIIAENFDGLGLRRDIEVNLGVPIAGRRVLMLGAGGAARGALQPFLDAGPAAFTLVNRTKAKAEALARQFMSFGAITAKSYDELGSDRFDIVVNATSASLHGEVPPIETIAFGAGCLAYELAYAKGLTPFLTVARAGGASRIADGVGMLVEQAAEAFAWWRGIRPATGGTIKDLTVPLR